MKEIPREHKSETKQIFAFSVLQHIVECEQFVTLSVTYSLSVSPLDMMHTGFFYIIYASIHTFFTRENVCKYLKDSQVMISQSK